MKLPLAWLRDYLDVELAPGDVAARLARLGFPVDAIDRRPPLSGVVVGRLARVEKHPDADRLQICTVDVGTPQTLTIATAATNVAQGQIVPVATIGARLVGLTIAPRTMRGVASEGMLCSAAEIGLEGSWFEDGILQLDASVPVGTDFVEYYRLGDAVLDVEVTANRVDALSIVGLARELAASFGTRVREPEIDRAPIAPDGVPPLVTIESADCRRFVAQRFSGAFGGIAPFWMRSRLALAGQRPIDALVDISNFVMLETAQPLHFYDYDRLAGGRVVVRDARAGEALRTLDGTDRALDGRYLVVADEREAQCVAGLMGGAASEVSAATRELLVEAATFAGPRVRRMSVALGLRTEASSRHEKGLPAGLATWGAARAAFLLQAAGATAHAPVAAGAGDAPAGPIDLDPALVRRLLGIEIGRDEARAALDSLGFGVAASASVGDGSGTEALAVTPPPWRGDVRIAEDVVEEIARVVGYDRIEAAMPPVFEQQVTSAAYRAESAVAHALAALGYVEAVTLALQPGTVAARYARAGIALPGATVEIANPLSEEQRYLRFSLVPGLLELAARTPVRPYRIFEVGHVFAGDPRFETAGVAWLAAFDPADEPDWHDAGFLRFKGESLALLRALTGTAATAVSASSPGFHPGKTASLLAGGRDVATIGAVDPRLLAAYGIEAAVYAGWMRLADLPAYRLPAYRAPSKYPPLARDLALVVAPEVPAADIEHAVRAGGDGAIADVRVFDEYRGPQVGAGRKSIAVRVVLQRADATMTDADADACIAAILASLRERCGADIRR